MRLSWHMPVHHTHLLPVQVVGEHRVVLIVYTHLLLRKTSLRAQKSMQHTRY